MQRFNKLSLFVTLFYYFCTLPFAPSATDAKHKNQHLLSLLPPFPRQWLSVMIAVLTNTAIEKKGGYFNQLVPAVLFFSYFKSNSKNAPVVLANGKFTIQETSALDFNSQEANGAKAREENVHMPEARV